MTMKINGAISQLRTTDLASSIRFYTETLGLKLEFQYQDFYAGVRAGDQSFHLKYVCDKDPSIEFVEDGGHFHMYFPTEDVSELADELRAKGLNLAEDLHETDWGTREFVIHDDQGHVLYFGQSLV